MALNYVTLTGKIQDAQGNPSGGKVTFTPGGWLTDTTDQLLVDPVPVTITLTVSGTFSVSLLATDNTAATPAGWTWTAAISPSAGPGYSLSFFLPFSGGATQDISALTPVLPVSAMAAYLPLAGGTMTGPLTLATTRETTFAFNSGATPAVNLGNGNVQVMTLTANATITLTGAVNTLSCSLSLYLKQDGTGGRSVTWPAAVKWPGGTAPSLSSAAGKTDLVILETLDGGTTWYGTLSGADFR